MELIAFRKNLAAGRTTVKRYGDSFSIEQRRFDHTCGDEIAPAIGTVTREEVQKNRDMLAENLAEADALLAEIDKLKGSK